MIEYWKHFKTVSKHKWEVFKECAACGIPLQGIVHDLSKFSPTEFVSSAKHFQGNKSPIEAEKEELGYSAAWLHHKGHNKHHWEYWIDFADDGSIIANRIPVKYVVEMACDYIGAGKAYNKEAWTPAEPLNYYRKVKDSRHFDDWTEMLFRYLLMTLNENGLEAFHKECKDILKDKAFIDRYNKHKGECK